MSKINFLPPWVETNLQPAFYDLESGTCLQQTARMYAKVNQLIRTVNEQNETIADYIQQFVDLHDYVYDYFDNLDVQQEINIKLDQMAKDGTLGNLIERYLIPYVDAQNARINKVETDFELLQQKVTSSISNNPVPVASVDDMINNDTVYVLTTNGHWYYYDEDEEGFVDGGAYQSASVTDLTSENLAEKGVSPISLKHYANYDVANQDYQYYTDYNLTGYSILDNGILVNSGDDNYRCYRYRIPNNSFITVKRNTLTDRFKVGLMTGTGTNVVELLSTASDKEFVTFYSGSYGFVVVQYTASGEDATINVLVESFDKLVNDIGAENLIPFEEVPANTNLYNPKLKQTNLGTGGDSGYPLQEYSGLYSYKFALERNLTYSITKNGTSNRFRVTLYNYEPITRVAGADTGSNAILCRPSEVVVNDNDETECTFNSGNYRYCIITYHLGGGFTDNVTFDITADGPTHQLSPQWYSGSLDLNGGVYVFNPGSNSADDYWSQWGGRLAFGMNTTKAPLPVQMNSQLFVNGTIISHNVGGANGDSYNRWGMHVYEAYAKDNWSRMTILTDKHQYEFDDKKSCEMYYYVGAGHNDASYGNMKIGSDVKDHSFAFGRDKMYANGVIDCTFPIQLARINQNTDLDDTYATVAQADNAYEPESQAADNIKCIKWIALHNASNGSMFYDTVRDKVVVKINDTWQDIQTTPVPAGTYNF